ncbi:MAG: hypothetical protein GX772_01595, partial [Alcaligenaceae bacterium]|nr:hypothetical protein [Alcaligenaceae bacterium]
LRQGLGLRLYAGVDALCAAVGAAGASQEPHVVVLAGEPVVCCQAARALRAVAPQARVLALQPSTTEASLLQGMGSGIDACWPQSAPAELIESAVLRLVGQACAPAQPRDGPWHLVSRAWVVRAPGGAEVVLTAAERAIMLALYHAPGRRASHASLIEAIESPDTNGSAVVSGYAWADARRLSVLVSRLRRKFIAAGTGIPIRSVRRVGYEISVDFAVQAVAATPVFMVSDTGP